jgi:hypothetical protein
MTTRTPTLDDAQDLKRTIHVPNNRQLEHEKDRLSQKPVLTQKMVRTYKKRNPPFYLFPLNQDETSRKDDIADQNVHQHVPLSLSDDNSY